MMNDRNLRFACLKLAIDIAGPRPEKVFELAHLLEERVAKGFDALLPRSDESGEKSVSGDADQAAGEPCESGLWSEDVQLRLRAFSEVVSIASDDAGMADLCSDARILHAFLVEGVSAQPGAA